MPIEAPPFLCMSGAGVAFPAQFFSVHCRCVALHFFSEALPGFAFAMQPHAIAFLCKAAAAHNRAFPARCSAERFQRVAGASIAAAMRLTAYPWRCVTKLCRSHAWRCHSGAKRYEAIPGHFIALHRPALPSLSELRQCLVLLYYSVASRVGTGLFPCKARRGVAVLLHLES